MRWKNQLRVFALTLTIGIAAGVIAYLFSISLNFVISVQQNTDWLFWLLPIGGTFVAYIYYRYGQQVMGGTTVLKEKIRTGDGSLPIRIIPLVWGGTLLTHLFGGSAGREGTALQLGGGVAAFFVFINRVTMDEKQRKTILLSGMSAGFAALFGTPLAAIIFVLEAIAKRKQRLSASLHCVLAAFSGYFVSTWLGIQHTAYTITAIPRFHLLTMVKLLLFVLAITCAAYVFRLFVFVVKFVLQKYIVLPYFRSFVGGIIIVILVYVTQSRDYLGLGLNIIEDAFAYAVSPVAAILKLLFTTITVGSGFIGGEVTPLFSIGSALGSSMAPLLHVAPSFLAALGFAALFGAVSKAPIAASILGMEVFGLDVLLPLLFVCLLSSLCTQLLTKTFPIPTLST
ncbi:chloride channel protein [Paenibacillus yanchengensis]|uniref:Chloride channel protein n=1 Tax=Paenibacillus yanchengensis TaxID=2035833 RepID=A0ABW4YQ59_9BACL